MDARQPETNEHQPFPLADSRKTGDHGFVSAEHRASYLLRVLRWLAAQKAARNREALQAAVATGEVAS